MRPHPVPANYRGRDQMTLVELIEDVEKVHFRTPYDTGANLCAMMIWNIIRQQAGLDALEEDDLIRKYYVDEKGMTWDDAKDAHKKHEDWYHDYSDRRNYRWLKEKYDG